MHVSVGRRFEGVRDLLIYSLVDIWDGTYIACESDYGTSTRAVPFVSSFDSIKRVCFGGTEDSSWITEKEGSEKTFHQAIPHHKIEDYNASEDFARMIDSFSIAFRSGLLPQSLEVKGLSCLHAELAAPKK